MFQIKINYRTILVYGYVRPSTPIHEVLQFKYQDDWIKQQQQAARAKLKEMQAKVYVTIFTSFFTNLLFFFKFVYYIGYIGK